MFTGTLLLPLWTLRHAAITPPLKQKKKELGITTVSIPTAAAAAMETWWPMRFVVLF